MKNLRKATPPLLGSTLCKINDGRYKCLQYVLQAPITCPSCKHRSAFVQVNAGDAERAIKTLHEHQFDGVSLYAHLKEWDDASPNDIMHAGW